MCVTPAENRPNQTANMKFARVLALASLAIAALAVPASAMFCGDANCFEVLGLTRNATKAEVRRAYRRLSSEMHPDKRPGVDTAAEEFRVIGTAYETLTDNEKRAKYEDFLDNPGKYWQYFMDNAKEHYAPKSNVFIVISGIIGIATLMHWINMNHSYRETLRRMRESQEFKREVTRLVKSKVVATREEAETMINLDIVGLEEPHWRSLFVFKVAALPGRFLRFLVWIVHWQIAYKILKREYTTADKLYLIQKNMGKSEHDWEAVSDADKEKFLEEELHDPENYAEYKRLERIELNKLGKGKKTKKRTPIPYSEAEEVNMAE